MGSTRNGVIPTGYRFSPTKVELVNHYLRNKTAGKRLSSYPVMEVDVYDLEPQFLPFTDGGGGRLKNTTILRTGQRNGRMDHDQIGWSRTHEKEEGFGRRRLKKKSTRMELWWGDEDARVLSVQ
uniref:NAC domain-containing protein n=1 Tax=Nelumbo nucifera TaxID=4432 RepID=A0A822YM04_NELNU|nr:TPA_asm: hypothetical protein HUJ06_011190 [Nelumbo nucifera]